MIATDVPKERGPEHYLVLERQAAFKSEYIDGRIVAMSGASLNHNLVSGNVFAAVHAQVRGGTCRAFGSDMRVKVGDNYFYPDVSVACPRPEVEGPGGDNLTNPTVVFEVLSPSTEQRDRTVKAMAYRRLPSLQAYVLVAQDRPFVECFRRHDPFWVYESFDSLDQTLELSAIGCRLSLADVYAGVTLEPHGD